MNNHSHDQRTTTGECEASCDTVIVDAAAVAGVVEALPDEASTRAVVAIFDALADPTRLRILQALALAGDLCVCDLAEITQVTSSAVSHQLRLLRDRDLVTFRREGKRAVYRLADAHVQALLAQGLDHAAERLGGRPGK